MDGFFKKVGDEIWFEEIDRDSLKISYKIKDIIYSKRSKFQDIYIVNSNDFGKMLVIDGVVQTTERDGFIYNEMISHVPLSMHENPKNVLIIGGGDLGAAFEATKYPVERIDVVEIDEDVVKASLEYLKEISKDLKDERVNFIFEDGAKFVREKKNEYDIIIVDSSDPIGPAEVLFSENFYRDVYNALKEDGIMACQSESPILYPDIFRATYKKLKNIFPIVKIFIATVPTYPGGFWSFTIGSKKYDKINKVNDIDTKYVTKEILESSFNIPKFVQNIIK
ncbi:polyamine aminopropyltransferase [Caloramator australicus]|uniref:Polyamine aminopropyltransferase n=1 Tax=Caloramator australicus RC3 TaxID=857293 RepID=I7K7A7_9CLOT|nr:polyamine aminopropyltransferase [Caloramator australicus]CCJ33404.1 Spermidine synthase [Caloramator australicus RC3]